MTRRRKILAGLAMLVVGGLTATAILVHSGCSTLPPVSGVLQPSKYRSQRLMALSAQEAALIPDIDVRLTRQLNLADLQIERQWAADAKATLASAVATLLTPEAAKLNDHARLSGWVSIAQLSRRAKDTALATQACDQAIAAVKAISDPGRRCQYVMGVANEIQYLKGLPAAAQLLASAGPWTRSIDNLPQRRQAVVAFASALFNLDDYSAGQAMLRQDDEPAWRSETLLSLASLPPASPAAAAALDAPAREAAPPNSNFYGRRLDYSTVFKNQQNSRTVKE